MRRKNNILTTLFSALLVLTLTACLQINELERNPDGAITFRVVSKKSTKGEEITTNTLNAFDVRAYNTTDGTKNESLFFTGAAEGSNADGWVFDGGTIYWPQENLNFFALAPQGAVNGTVNENGMEIPDIVIDGQKDLVYAMNANEAKSNHIASPVALNFRHALSQVVFRASNTNWRLHIQIFGIRIVGVNDKGSYKIGNKSTGSASNNETVWFNQSSSIPIKDVKYAAMPTQSWGATIPQKNDVDFFTGPFEGGMLGGNTPAGQPAETSPLFLMPQKLDTWTVTVNPDKTYSATGSARIEVLCIIWQKRTDNGWSWPWPTIWPRPSMPAEKLEHGAAWVAVPLTNPTELINGEVVEVGWKPGKKYVYSLVFGEGAGYNPDLDTPAIVPIRFKVSVEDFTDGGTHDVPE